MKFLLDNWHLILVALTSGGLLVWHSMRGAAAGGAVTTAEAVRLINREKGVLIDVREPAEFAKGHAVGARNVPLGQLEGTPSGLPANKGLPLLVMCASGPRATRAAALLKKQGYEKSLPVAGGLAAWREANLPVETSA